MSGKVKSGVVRALLAVAMVVILVGCAQGAPQAGDGQLGSQSEDAASQAEQATPQAEQAAPQNTSTTEEVHLVAPVAVTDREPSGQWNASDGPTWLEMYDVGADEEMEFEEIDAICNYFDLREYDRRNGEHDYPDSLHVVLSDGTEGSITNPDIINDLWGRVLYMRLSPDLAMADSGALYTNELVFSWDDGRTQTFTFKGQTALAVDGVLFPIIEDVYTGAEVFSDYSVSRLENDKYPGAVFDIARMMIEDGLGKRKAFIIKSGTTRMRYSRDSFDWDAANDGIVETYSVKSIKESDGTKCRVRIKEANASNQPSCNIEGAERIYVVEMKRDDAGYIYPEITYQPQDSEDRATCTIKMEKNGLVVSYQ